MFWNGRFRQFGAMDVRTTHMEAAIKICLTATTTPSNRFA